MATSATPLRRTRVGTSGEDEEFFRGRWVTPLIRQALDVMHGAPHLHPGRPRPSDSSGLLQLGHKRKRPGDFRSHCDLSPYAEPPPRCNHPLQSLSGIRDKYAPPHRAETQGTASLAPRATQEGRRAPHRQDFPRNAVTCGAVPAVGLQGTGGLRSKSTQRGKRKGAKDEGEAKSRRRSRKVKKCMHGLVRHVGDATEHASHQDGREGANHVSGLLREYLPPRSSSASPIEETESSQSRVRAKLRAAVEGIGDVSTKAVVLGRRSMALTRPMDLPLEDMLHLSQSMGHPPCSIANEHRSPLQLVVEADRARPNTTSTCIEGHVVLFDVDMQLLGSAAPASSPVVGVECRSLSVTPNGLRSRHGETEALVLVQTHLLPKDVIFVALAVRSPGEQSWVDHGGGVCRARSKGQSFAPLGSRSFRFMVKQSKVDDMAGVSNDVCEGEGVAAQEASSMWKSSWQRIPPQSMVLCGVLYRHAYKPDEWLTKMIEPVEAMARPFSLFESLAGIVDDLRANGVVPYHLLHIEYERCIADSSTTTSQSSRLADDMVQAVRATLPPMAITVTGNSTQYPQDSFELTFKRYGPSRPQLVYSKLLSHSCPTVQGVVSWLSVATLIPAPFSEHRDKVRLMIRLIDAYTGRPLSKPATVELHQVEVIISRKSIFRQAEEQPHRTDMPNSKHRRRSLVRPRTAWGAHDQPADQDNMNKTTKRSRSPHERGCAHRAVRTMARRASDDHAMEFDEEAEVEAFLADYMPRDERRRLINAGGITNMLILLGLDEDDLEDLGVRNPATRRKLFQAILKARLCIQSGGHGTSAVKPLNTPIDLRNPFGLARLEGWSERSDCVSFRRLGQVTSLENGKAIMSVADRGACIVRVDAQAYHRADSEVFKLTGEGNASVEVTVSLWPRRCKCLMTLTDVNKLQADLQSELQGQPIELINIHAGRSHVAHIQPTLTAEWSIPAGFYTIAGIPNSITCINPAEGKAAPLKLNALVLLHALHRRRREASGRIVRFLSHAATSDTAPRAVEGQPQPSAAECARPPGRTDFVGVWSPGDNTQGLRSAQLEFAAARTVDDGRNSGVTPAENCDTAPAGNTSPHTDVFRLAPAQESLRMPQVDQSVGEKTERRGDEPVACTPSQAWRPMHPDNLCPTILVSAEGDVYGSMPQTGLPKPPVGAREARHITAGLRESTAAALTSLAGSVQRREYINALGSVVKVQAFIRMMLAYLPYTRRKSRLRSADASDAEDDHSCDFCSRPMSPASDDGDGAIPAEADAPSALEAALGIAKPERAAGETTSEVCPEPVGEPPPAATQRGSRATMPKADAVVVLQKTVRRFVAQKKAVQLLKPFTAVLRLIDLNGLAVVTWVKNIEWYFSIVHRDCRGHFKSILKTRTARMDTTRVLGQGFLLRNVRITDQIEISLMCRVLVKHARGDRTDLRKKGYKTIQQDLVSPWACLYERDVHLMALDNTRQRIVLPLNGRGGRYQVPLLPASGLENIVASWVVDGCFKINVNAPWPRGAAAEALPPAAAFKQEEPVLYVEAFPVPFHATRTLSLVCRNVHLLDAPLLESDGRLETSMSAVTAMTSWGEDVFVVQQDRILSQWGYTHSRGWRASRATQLQGPCSAISTLGPFILAGLADGVLVGYRKDTAGLDAVFEAVVHDSRFRSIIALSHTSSELFVAGAENGHVALVAPAIDPQLRWSWRTLPLDVGSSITSLASSTVALYVGAADTQVYAYGFTALLSDEVAPVEAYAVFTGHSDAVQSLVCSKAQFAGGAGEELLFTGGADGRIFVLRADTLGFIGRLEGHSMGVTSLVLDDGGRYLISSSLDSSIRVWDICGLWCERCIEGSAVTTMCAWNNVLLTSESRQGQVDVWGVTERGETVDHSETHLNRLQRYATERCIAEPDKGLTLLGGSLDQFVDSVEEMTDAGDPRVAEDVDEAAVVADSNVQQATVSADMPSSVVHEAEIVTETTPRDGLNATEHVSSLLGPPQTEGAAGDAGSTIDVVLTEVTTTTEACTEPPKTSTKTVIFYTSSPSASLSRALDPMLPPASTLHKSLKSSRRGVSASTPRLGRVPLPQDSPTRSPATSPVRTSQLDSSPGPPSSTCQLAEDVADTCERDLKAQSMVLDEPVLSETRSCLEQDPACGPAIAVSDINLRDPSLSCNREAVELSAATRSVAESPRSTVKEKEADEAGVYETECVTEGKALQADLPYHTVETNGAQCGLDISLSAERFETVVDDGSLDVMARGSAEQDEAVPESIRHLSYVQDSQKPRSPAEGRRSEAACEDGLITSVDSPDYAASQRPAAQVLPDDSLSSFLLVPLHVFTKSLPGGDEVSISIYARHDGGFVLEGRVLRVQGMCCSEIIPGDLSVDLPLWDSMSEVERSTAMNEVQDVVTVGPIRLQKGKGQLVFTLDGDLADFKAGGWLVTLAMEAGVSADHLSIIDITAGSVVVRVLTTERLGYSVWEQYQHGRVRCNGTIKRVEFFTGRVRITLRRKTPVSDQKPQLGLSWATDTDAPIVDAADGRFSDAEGSFSCVDSRGSPSHRHTAGAHVQPAKENELPSSQQTRQHREIQPGTSSFPGELQSREASDFLEHASVAGPLQNGTSNADAVVAVVEPDASADTAVVKGGMVKETVHVDDPDHGDQDHGEAAFSGKPDLDAAFPIAPGDSVSECTINDLNRSTAEMSDGLLSTGPGLSSLPGRMTTKTDTSDFMATLLEGATQTLHPQQAPAVALSTMGKSDSVYDTTRDSMDEESGDEDNGLIFVTTLHISNSHVLVSLYATSSGGMTVYGLCPATSERLSLDLQPSDWAVTGYADLRQLNSAERSALAEHIISALELPPAMDCPLTPRRLCLGPLCASRSRTYRNLGSTDTYEKTLKHFLCPTETAPLKETLTVSSPTGTWHKHTWRDSVSRLSQEYVKAFGDHTALLSMRTTSQKDVEVTGYIMETQEELNLVVSNAELARTLSPPKFTPELLETWAEYDELGAGGSFTDLDSLAHSICLADVGGRATLVLQPGLQRLETEAMSSIEHDSAAGGESQPAGEALTCQRTDPSPSAESVSMIDGACRSAAHSARQYSQTPRIHPNGDSRLVFDKVKRISMQWVRVMMCELEDGRLLCEAASPTLERLQILVDDIDWADTGLGPWQSLSSHERQDLLDLVASNLHLIGTVGAQSIMVDWDAVRGPEKVPLTACAGLRLTTLVSESASTQTAVGAVERATMVIAAVEFPEEDVVTHHAMMAATTQCAHEPHSSSAAMEQHSQSAGATSLAPGGSRQVMAASQAKEANATLAFEQPLPISSTSLPNAVKASAGSAKDRHTVITPRSSRSTTSTVATFYVTEVIDAAISHAMENGLTSVQYVALRPSSAQHSQDRRVTATQLGVAEGSQSTGAAGTLAQEPCAPHTAPTTDMAPSDEAKGRSPSSLTVALSDLSRAGPAAKSWTGPNDQDVGATPAVEVVRAIGPPACGDDSEDVNCEAEHEDDTSLTCDRGDAHISAVAVVAELNLPTPGAFARAAQTHSTVTTPRSSRSTTSTVATCYVTEMMDAAVTHAVEDRLSIVQHVACRAPLAQHGLVTATQLGVAEGSQPFGAAGTLAQEPCAMHTGQATNVAPPDEAKGPSTSSLTGALSHLARAGPAAKSWTGPNDQDVGATPAVEVVRAIGPPACGDDSEDVNCEAEHEDDTSLTCDRGDAHISAVAVVAELNLPTPGAFARAAQTHSTVTTPRSSRSTTSTVATCYVTEMMDAAVTHAVEDRLSIVQHVACRAPLAQHGLVTATQLGVAEGSQPFGAAGTLAQEPCAMHTGQATNVAPPDEAKGPSTSSLTGALSHLARAGPAAKSLTGPNDQDVGATPALEVVRASGPPAGGDKSRNVNLEDEHEEDDISLGCDRGEAHIRAVAVIAELNLPTHGASARAAQTYSTVATPRSSRSTTSTVATCYVTEMVDAVLTQIMGNRLSIVQHVACRAPSSQKDGSVTATELDVVGVTQAVGALDMAFHARSHDADALRSHSSDATFHVADAETAMTHSAYEAELEETESVDAPGWPTDDEVYCIRSGAVEAACDSRLEPDGTSSRSLRHHAASARSEYLAAAHKPHAEDSLQLACGTVPSPPSVTLAVENGYAPDEAARTQQVSSRSSTTVFVEKLHEPLHVLAVVAGYTPRSPDIGGEGGRPKTSGLHVTEPLQLLERPPSAGFRRDGDVLSYEDREGSIVQPACNESAVQEGYQQSNLLAVELTEAAHAHTLNSKLELHRLETGVGVPDRPATGHTVEVRVDLTGSHAHFNPSGPVAVCLVSQSPSTIGARSVAESPLLQIMTPVHMPTQPSALSPQARRDVTSPGAFADCSVCPAVPLLNLSPSESPLSSAGTSHRKSRSGQAAPSAVGQGHSADAHSVAKPPSSTSHATIAVAELPDPQDRLVLTAKLEHHSALVCDERTAIDLTLPGSHGHSPPEANAPSATSSCGGASDRQGKVAYKGLRREANTRLLLAIREMEDGRLLVQATPGSDSADEAMSLVVDDMDWAVTGLGPWQSLSAQEQQKLVATITDNLHVSTAALKVDWSAAASVVPLTTQVAGTATVRPEEQQQASARSAGLSARSIASDNQKVLCDAMTRLQGDVASHQPNDQQCDETSTYIDVGMGMRGQDVTCERVEDATDNLEEGAAKGVESQEVSMDQAEDDHEGETEGTATALDPPQHAVADMVMEQCNGTDRMLDARGGSDVSADLLSTARSAASTASAKASTDRTQPSSVANDFQVMKAAMSKRKTMESSLRDAAAEYRRWLSTTQIVSPTPTDQSQAMAAAAFGSDTELSPTALMTAEVLQPDAWDHQRTLSGWEAEGFDDDLRGISASAQYATRLAYSPGRAATGEAVLTEDKRTGPVVVMPSSDCAAATGRIRVVVASSDAYAPVTDAELVSSTVAEIPQGTDSVDSARAAQATSPTHDLALSGQGESGEQAIQPEFVKGQMSFSSDRRPSEDSYCSSVEDPIDSAPTLVYKGVRRGAEGQLLVSVRVSEDGQLLVRAVSADPAFDDQLELALSHTDWAATGLGPLLSLSPDKRQALVQTIVSNLHVVCEGGMKALKVELPTCPGESDYQGSIYSASLKAEGPRDGDERTSESVQQPRSTEIRDTSEEHTDAQLDGGPVSCSALHEESYKETPSDEGQSEVHTNSAKGALDGDPQVREGSPKSGAPRTSEDTETVQSLPPEAAAEGFDVDSAFNVDQREDRIERATVSPPASAPEELAVLNDASRADTEHINTKSRTPSPSGLADASSGPAVKCTEVSALPNAVGLTSPAAGRVMASVKTSESSSSPHLGPQLPVVLEAVSTSDPPKNLDVSSKASLSTERPFDDSTSSSHSSSGLDGRLLFKGVRRTSRGRLVVSVREGADCLVITAVPTVASGVEVLHLDVDEKQWQATGLGPWQTLATDEQQDLLNLVVNHLRVTVSGAGEATGLMIDWATAGDHTVRLNDASIRGAQHAADVDQLREIQQPSGPGADMEVRSSADESTDENKRTACAALPMQIQQDSGSQVHETSLVECIAPASQRPPLTSQQAEGHEPSSQKLHGGMNAKHEEDAKDMVASGQDLQEVLLTEKVGSGGEEPVRVLDLQQAPSDALSCSSTTSQGSSNAAYHPLGHPTNGLTRVASVAVICTDATQDFGPESTRMLGREGRPGESAAEHVQLMRQRDSVLTAAEGPFAQERLATDGLPCISQSPALLPPDCVGPSEQLKPHQGERKIAEAIAEARMHNERATATSVVRVPHVSEAKLEMPRGLYTVPSLADEKAAKLARVELKLSENSPFIKLGPSEMTGGSSQLDSGMLTTEPSIDADRKAASTAEAGTPALSATKSRQIPTLLAFRTEQEKQSDGAQTAAPMETEKAEQFVSSHNCKHSLFQVADCSDGKAGQVGTSFNADIVAGKEQLDEPNNRGPMMCISARKSPASHTPRLTGPQELDVVESKLRSSSSSASLNTLEPRSSDVRLGRDGEADAACQPPHPVVNPSNDSGDLDRHTQMSADSRLLHEADGQRMTTATPVLSTLADPAPFLVDAPSDLRSLAARQDCDDASCLSVVSHASSVVEQEGLHESYGSELSPSRRHHGAERVVVPNVANAESKVEAGLPPRAPRTNVLRPLRRQSADVQRQARRSCAAEAQKVHHEPRRRSLGDSYEGTPLGSARSDRSAASNKTTSSLVFKGMKRTRSNSIMIISVAQDDGTLLVTCNIPSASLTLQHVLDDGDWAHTGYGPWDALTRANRHKLVTLIVGDLHVTENAESLPILSFRTPPTASEPSPSQWTPARPRKRTGDLTASPLPRTEQAQNTCAATERKTSTVDAEERTRSVSGVDTRQGGQSYVSAASDRSTGSVVYKGLRRAPSKSVMIVSVTQDDGKLLIEASIPSSSESSRYVIDDLDWQPSTGLGPWGVLTADERSRLVDVIARNLQIRDTDTIEIVGIDWPISALYSAREEVHNGAKVAVATAARSSADGSQTSDLSIRVIETMGTQRSGAGSAVLSSARPSKDASSPVVCEMLHLAPLASTVIASVLAEGDGGLAIKGTAKASTESVECEVDWSRTSLSSWELLKTSERQEQGGYSTKNLRVERDEEGLPGSLNVNRPVSVQPSPHGDVNGDSTRRRTQSQHQTSKACDDLVSADGLPFDASLDGSYACATGQRSSGSEDVFLDHSSFICSNSAHLMDSTAFEAEEGLTTTSVECAEKQGCCRREPELSDGQTADEASKLRGAQDVKTALEMLPPELSVDEGKP